MSDLPQVFIPSRGRALGAKKLTDAWHKEGFSVNWVVEPDEWATYANKVENAKIYPLPMSNAGIGYSRHHCVALAASFGYKSIILADDDIKPAKNNANMDFLVEDAEHPKVLGITARYSYHDLCLGDHIKGRDDIILLPTGTFRLVALNVQNALAIGNYDYCLEYAEDCDLFLRGLQEGFPWMVHLGTWTNSIGTRYAPGGLSDFVKADNVDLREAKFDWHRDLYTKWPDFINDPAKADFDKQNSIRVSWRKAYNQLMPDWQKYSALHGGDIGNYLDDE